MRALVTGSAGFVGRHMVDALNSRGWTTDVCDLRIGSDARDIFRDETRVYDLVVHCAYHVGGRARIDGETTLLALNVELDSRLFEWAVRTGQKRVLYFSSSAAYPVSLQRIECVKRVKLQETDIDLDHVRQPDALYGWAKLTGERMANAASAAGVVTHVVRPFSGYGEDQDPDEYPFPAIVHRASRGDHMVWGPPGQCRDWIHIDDVVAGALSVVNDDERRPINLCTGEPTEFGKLSKIVAELAGLNPGTPIYDKSRPTGVMYRVGHPGRMREHYTPNVTLRDGIERALKRLASG
jgi:nucleoside-diphosphate-sugar epimerase